LWSKVKERYVIPILRLRSVQVSAV
jgi:hypothetical protein